jgi:hypothetical protein
MAIQYSVTHRTNAMTQLITDIGASCTIKIFTGSIPTNCATADTGTLLVTFVGGSPFGTADTGILTVNTISNATATGNGTAGYFRIYPSVSNPTNAVMQGTCGTSGTDMILTTATINNGNTIQFTSMSITAFGV